MITNIDIREIRKDEYEHIGKLMVDIYSELEGFPTPEEQPGYYDKLLKIGNLNEQIDTQVLVAISHEGTIVGGVVYFSDMAQYGSGGTATTEKNASGIRLLGGRPEVSAVRYRKGLSQSLYSDGCGSWPFPGYLAYDPSNAGCLEIVPGAWVRALGRLGFYARKAACIWFSTIFKTAIKLGNC